MDAKAITSLLMMGPDLFRLVQTGWHRGEEDISTIRDLARELHQAYALALQQPPAAPQAAPQAAPAAAAATGHSATPPAPPVLTAAAPAVPVAAVAAGYSVTKNDNSSSSINSSSHNNHHDTTNNVDSISKINIIINTGAGVPPPPAAAAATGHGAGVPPPPTRPPPVPGAATQTAHGAGPLPPTAQPSPPAAPQGTREDGAGRLPPASNIPPPARPPPPGVSAMKTCSEYCCGAQVSVCAEIDHEDLSSQTYCLRAQGWYKSRAGSYWYCPRHAMAPLRLGVRAGIIQLVSIGTISPKEEEEASTGCHWQKRWLLTGPPQTQQL